MKKVAQIMRKRKIKRQTAYKQTYKKTLKQTESEKGDVT